MKSKRTYGKIEFNAAEKKWYITQAEPHVCIKLKQIFAKIPKTAVVPFKMNDLPETCSDLYWFMLRYPLSISDKDFKLLSKNKKIHTANIAELERIMLPDYKSASTFKIKENSKYQERAYQISGVDIYYKCKRLLIGDDLGLGKAQPLTARIATPSGWKIMGEMAIGTELFGTDGKIYNVSGVFPQGDRPAYRVTFNDGSFTECDIDHLWKVRDKNRKYRFNTWTNKTTSELLESGLSYNPSQKRIDSGTALQLKWEIPSADAVEYKEKQFLIPPYTMGALIGDGCMMGDSMCISVPESKNEILERIKLLLHEELKIRPNMHPACPQYFFTQKIKTANNVYRTEIRRLCLLNVKSREKFIPIEYMCSSIEQRIDLLRGLMDTDGSAKQNRITFHTCSPVLAQNIKELVHSLGGQAISRKYDRSKEGKGLEWQVNIRVKFCPFYLEAKKRQWKSTRTYARKIKSIESIGICKQQCISVTAPDKLYLTDEYIVTHNTTIATLSFLKPGTLPAIVVVQSNLQDQWKEQIEMFTDLKVHLIKVTAPYNLPPADVYITKYSCLAGWVNVFSTGMFKSAVFDETQELRRVESEKYGGAEVLAANVEYCLGLTATPIMNYANEIWNILNIIKKDCLGDFYDFLREWTGSSYGNKPIVTDTAALGTYLRENFFFLRRTREDVNMAMTPVNRLVHEISHDQEEVDKAQDIAKMLAIKIFEGDYFERGAASRQMDMLLRHITGVSKARYVAEYVKILLDAGEPVVLAGWHRDVYEIWGKELAEYKPVFYTGTESPKQKKQSFNSFTSGETNLFIISLRSGAGLDGLQFRCKWIVIGELDWSPKVLDQLIGRVDRPGQEEEVSAVFLISAGGSDPHIINLLGLKASQAHGIVDPLRAIPGNHVDESRIKELARQYYDKSLPLVVKTDILYSSCCNAIMLKPDFCPCCEKPAISKKHYPAY